MTATGKRVRKVFLTEPAAEKYAGKLRASHNSGVRGGMISATLAAQAIEAERILEGTGLGLVDAAKQAAARLKDESSKEPFKLRYDRAILANEEHWRDRYKADMERLPRWLPKWFMDTPCGVIDRAEIERALTDGKKLARSTIDMRAARVLAILGYRERHRSSVKIRILTEGEVAAMFEACETADEKRVLAVLLFAGIRPDAEGGEISRIQWEDIGERYITVHPDASKTGSDRLVPITPRLKAELKGHPKTGPVAPAGWRKRWQRIRKTASISGQDVTRHTFASHFLAWKGDKATKEALGHTAGSETLFRHYRRAVTTAAGRAYFQVETK
jgi:integrase